MLFALTRCLGDDQLRLTVEDESAVVPSPAEVKIRHAQQPQAGFQLRRNIGFTNVFSLGPAASRPETTSLPVVYAATFQAKIQHVIVTI